MVSIQSSLCLEFQVLLAEPIKPDSASTLVDVEPGAFRKHSLVRLIDFLHLGRLICSALNLFKWWEVIVIAKALVVVINAEAKLDHAVNAACKLSRLVEVEARRQ